VFSQKYYSQCKMANTWACFSATEPLGALCFLRFAPAAAAGLLIQRVVDTKHNASKIKHAANFLSSVYPKLSQCFLCWE